jgi:YT521-B-like domain
MMYLPQGGVTGSMRFNQYPGDPRFHTLSTMSPLPPTSMPQHPTAVTSSPGGPADYRPRRTSQLSRSSRDSSPRSAQQPQLPSPQERHPSIDSNASNPSVRYFILKSLTADDLDISVERGVWATQPHNEASLNRAFKTSSAVYLIFSANKSGEFYGYARMLQPIVPNLPSSPSTQVQWTPITMEEDEEEGSSAPTGQDHVDPPPPSDAVQSPVEDDPAHPSADGNEKRWGNAFKVQWIKV